MAVIKYEDREPRLVMLRTIPGHTELSENCSTILPSRPSKCLAVVYTHKYLPNFDQINLFKKSKIYLQIS